MIGQRLALASIFVVLGLSAACGGAEQAEPTAAPVTRTKPVIQVEPQSQALMLSLASPEVNLVTESGQVTVAGVTSPDATLSLNGRLDFPDPEGIFSDA